MNRRPEVKPCKSCGANIYWALTRNGKRMPIDAAPTSDGGFVASLVRGELHLDMYVPTESSHQRRNRYTSHFVTCPNAAQHRRTE